MVQARSIKMRAYRRRRRRPDWQPALVPADRARAHLEHLRANGVGLRRMAQLGEIHDTRHLGDILTGRRTRIFRHTEAMVLALPVSLASGKHIDAVVVHRMIHALMAIGWSCSEIDRERGVRVGTTQSLLGNQGTTPRTQDEVYRWYEKLSARTPTPRDRYEKSMVTRTKTLAQRNGWAPPLAWDDILDPDELPQGVSALTAGYLVTVSNAKGQVLLVGGKNGQPYKSEERARLTLDKLREQYPNAELNIQPVQAFTAKEEKD